MKPVLLKLPHYNEQHGTAHSYMIKNLFTAKINLYLGIYIESSDLTIEWNNVYDFWDITVFFDDRVMIGNGSLKHREQAWARTKVDLPAAFGSTPRFTSRWPKHVDEDGQQVLPLEMTEGFRFWVHPDKIDKIVQDS